ncbi:MAG: uracil-DNA glycosylase [Chloroflexi bacterium]|nr:uracil-DNA glycosylase [Chloroflexota bacterium]
MTPLQELHQKISACPRCALARTRVHAVPGEGPEKPDIVFIGEAPGFNEDQQGRPFVGAAGQFLEELLSSIGLHRKDVYITNVIKCRPPENRDPLPGEIEACRSWLDKQLELLCPKLVVTLGRYSMAHFFPKENISKVHGKARKRDSIIYYAMYHPAAALHQPSLRNTIIEDMKKIPEILAQASKIQEEEKKPEQLSML